MQFIDGDVGVGEKRRGIAISSAVIPVSWMIMLSLFFPHPKPYRVTYLVGALAIGIVVSALSAFTARSIRRSGEVIFTPLSVLGTCCLLALSVGLFDVSSGGQVGIYRMSLCLTVGFVAIIGDLTMNVIAFLFVFGVLIWSTWASGTTGGPMMATVLVDGSALAAVQLMVAIAVRSTFGRGKLREGLQTFNQVASSAETIEGGLEACLPMVESVMATDHVVAFIGDDSRNEYLVKSAWPAYEDGDLELRDSPEFAEAINRHTTIITEEHCFMPVGFAGTGNLVLVIHKKVEGNEFSIKNLLSDFNYETADALASSLVRMINRVALKVQIRRESQTDPLTGLPSRIVLLEHMENDMARAQVTRDPLSVAMIDLDHLKHYNEEKGTLSGDRLLKEVASIMSAAARSHDLLVRYSGGEFCLWFPETGVEGATYMVERIREALGPSLNGTDVTLSAGVASWDGNEGSGALLRRVDQALFSAKQQGRDQVVAASFLPG